MTAGWRKRYLRHLRGLGRLEHPPTWTIVEAEVHMGLAKLPDGRTVEVPRHVKRVRVPVLAR